MTGTGFSFFACRWVCQCKIHTHTLEEGDGLRPEIMGGIASLAQKDQVSWASLFFVSNELYRDLW